MDKKEVLYNLFKKWETINKYEAWKRLASLYGEFYLSQETVSRYFREFTEITIATKSFNEMLNKKISYKHECYKIDAGIYSIYGPSNQGELFYDIKKV
jgi:hypothetical protein